MVNVKDNKSIDDASLKAELENAAQAFLPVQKVKADETRLTDFQAWNKQLEVAFNTIRTLIPIRILTDSGRQCGAEPKSLSVP
jgi:outer membrane protein assembly factor BamA